MKCLIAFAGLILFGLPCFGGEPSTDTLAGKSVKHFKDIAPTVSLPHHFEGLYPSLNPQSESHYEFILNNRFSPIRITYFDKLGKITNTPDNWAVLKMTYDEKSRLTESAFYRANGDLVVSKSLRFAREVVEYDEMGGVKQTFYNPKGKPLKSPQKDWRSDFPESL
ncbi:MAG: hypothetical protein A2W61_04460 [Deltaproteobacteria bacterium RIFCSPLOWO2_01_44_7]|nr:MAG: hypothetical protein A2712_10240 [Deltaproteobacteria bacterium RIFCSPHIGHO2_01_FULL_43_49]OGQ15488.1 MAG: hypothetical protein A3D22_10770 [Deltaproteobacteria bacterium RIFCSPHIGHO2_02_FULL_44_53]OGQ29681.1 MAG: hypothetical protein A3D98_10970 [Deltaproteobacteria bacterium RIFCSPHIGHO2_12_FULL_44_21]OGQ32294.1 MAG: hypothetical protein A2979_00615 [Deltaproteobacteria bacterium RIFCSPLOWO2_01_FULL_45_74]OGQ40012.1 MAG: hypothetical protein A2W61_04460 [Deltaproteobacteria bacterium 